jgi:hypothetical protein
MTEIAKISPQKIASKPSVEIISEEISYEDETKNIIRVVKTGGRASELG